jgi:hypothetical protein
MLQEHAATPSYVMVNLSDRESPVAVFRSELVVARRTSTPVTYNPLGDPASKPKTKDEPDAKRRI